MTRTAVTGATRSVLVVDDDHGNRVTLTVLFEDEGFAAEAVCSFAEALERIQRGPDLDAVVLDMRLGDGHGMALAPHIRARMPGAKIIGITGADDGNIRAAELDALLDKTSGFETLLDIIDRLLGPRQAIG